MLKLPDIEHYNLYFINNIVIRKGYVVNFGKNNVKSQIWPTIGVW